MNHVTPLRLLTLHSADRHGRVYLTFAVPGARFVLKVTCLLNHKFGLFSLLLPSI